MKRLAISLFSLVLFAGCGAGSSSRPPPAPKPVPSQLGWFYSITKAGTSVNIGPYPWHPGGAHGLAICRDWLGSIGCAHGNQCLPNPTPKNCACLPASVALGIAASVGATQSGDCSQKAEAGFAPGYYYIDAAILVHGPYGKAQCMALAPAPKPRRSYCFGIGAVPNTEGSAGGP